MVMKCKFMFWKAEQTAEEVERTERFKLEATELLSFMSDAGLLLAKFNPIYQQHFGRPLKVGLYGFKKLIQLLQAVPDVLEVYGAGNHKMVRLVRPSRFGTKPSPQSIPKSSPCEASHTVYHQEKANSLKEAMLARSCTTLLLAKSDSEQLVSLLMEQPGGTLDIGQLWEAHHLQYGGYPDLSLLRRLEETGAVQIERQSGRVRLSPSHRVSQELMALLGGPSSPPMLVARLELAFFKRYNAPFRAHPHGFSTLEDFLSAFPYYFTLMGPKDRRTVCVAKARMNGGVAPAEVEDLLFPSSPSRESSVEALSEHASEPELLELRRSPVDLLNGPIPSGVPSPEIVPEIRESAAVIGSGAGLRDLIKFDLPVDDGNGPVTIAESIQHVANLPSPVPQVPTTPQKLSGRPRIAAQFAVPLGP